MYDYARSAKARFCNHYVLYAGLFSYTTENKRGVSYAHELEDTVRYPYGYLSRYVKKNEPRAFTDGFNFEVYLG